MRYLTGLLLALVLCLPLLAQAAGQKTLQNAATVTADGSNLATENAGAVGVSLTISATATVTFKGSADGGLTWSAITCTNIDTLVSAQTASSTGQYQCPVAGLSHFQTPAAITSGTVTSIATASPGSLGSSNSSANISSLATATAAAPTYAEGASVKLSTDLAGNTRVTQGTLESCEDQANLLCMVGPGVVRVTTFSLVHANSTSSSTTILPDGPIRFMAAMGGASESKAFTIGIYGNYLNSTTGGILLCTITITAATTTHIEDICPLMTPNFSYYFFTSSAYTSASSADIVLTAMY